MTTIPAEVAEVIADTSFSGVVRVDAADGSAWTNAYGSASGRFGVPNRPDTVFGIASGTKGFVALTIASLIEQGVLAFSTTARSLLGPDLPLVDDRVTVEHLLAHRSGIGDYLDEDTWSPSHYVMPVPVHELDSTPAYLPVLAGRPQVRPPGEAFTYNNSGYVVAALLAERATGRSLGELIDDHVCRPAGLTSTSLARTDDPPSGAAEGYVAVDGGRRSNVLHLPVLGGGDGGLYATAADLTTLWIALFDGRIVRTDTVAELVRPRSDVPAEDRRYGLGFWLHRSSDVVMLEGMDAGISFRSLHDPIERRTLTTISNTSGGVWPVTAALERHHGYD